ncbi:MFS transporter [Paenibacillus sp. P26]|nr:MFS transporter [Paenibacillus sp. P26]
MIYSVILYILLQAFGIRRIEGEQKKGVTIRSAWGVIVRDRVFRLYIIGAAVGAVGYSQMTVSLSQYVEKSVTEGATLFALLMTLNAVTVVLLQVPLSRWFEKKGPMAAIATGSLMFASGDVGYALSTSWAWFMVSMFLFTLGEILTYPAGNVLIDRLAPDGSWGTYFGAQSFSSIGQFIGPLIGGYILSKFGGETLFALMAAVSISGIYFYWKGHKMTKIVQNTYVNELK